jgi:hypothetical protein
MSSEFAERREATLLSTVDARGAAGLGDDRNGKKYHCNKD